MNTIQFRLDDIVEMRKKHPCGDNRMRIIRMGADIRIKCCKCDHSFLIPRSKFERNLKRVLNNSYTVNNTDKFLTVDTNQLKFQNAHFHFPSTDDTETKGGEKLEEALFAETSELYKLGYRITGLKRTDRRRILTQVAIPKLGLEKVVHTITTHIRNRKKQVNGSVIYKYAIAEWEDDLAFIKNQFLRTDSQSNYKTSFLKDS